MLADSHNDFLTNLNGENLNIYIDSLKENVISSAVFTNENFSIDKIKSLTSKIYKYNYLILSIEDLGFIKNVNDLNELIKLKPFSTTLTWNDSNQFAGGAHSHTGLTSLGMDTIEKIEENNILIDTAHLNRVSFYEFIELTRFPIYNSHSNIDSIYSHPRNLTDEQINKIVKSNGYIGITLYQKFISADKITSLDIAMQFDYLIRTYSSYHCGFGTDFYGIDTEFLPIDINNYNDLDKVANHLISLGHSHQVVDRIMYKNFLDFYKNINSLTL